MEGNKPKNEVKSVEKDLIVVHKVLPKNKGYVLKVYPSEKELTRKLVDIYWLQNSLMVEFPYYYVS